MPGTVAVVLGGSRALVCDDEGSDWDLGLYYRGAIDLTTLSTHGTVFLVGTGDEWRCVAHVRREQGRRPST